MHSAPEAFWEWGIECRGAEKGSVGPHRSVFSRDSTSLREKDDIFGATTSLPWWTSRAWDNLTGKWECTVRINSPSDIPGDFSFQSNVLIFLKPIFKIQSSELFSINFLSCSCLLIGLFMFLNVNNLLLMYKSLAKLLTLELFKTKGLARYLKSVCLHSTIL